MAQAWNTGTALFMMGSFSEASRQFREAFRLRNQLLSRNDPSPKTHTSGCSRQRLSSSCHGLQPVMALLVATKVWMIQSILIVLAYLL